jgi:hypothetical protein
MWRAGAEPVPLRPRAMLAFPLQRHRGLSKVAWGMRSYPALRTDKEAHDASREQMA